MATRKSSKPKLVAERQSATQVTAQADIEAFNALYRAIIAFDAIEDLAIDTINTSDSRSRDTYQNAIKALARLHGSELDNALAQLQRGHAVGCFGGGKYVAPGSEAANG